MSDYRGDIAPGQVLYVFFNTRDKANSAPITFAGTPSLCVYRDNETGEVTTGLSLSVDHDGKTGRHLATIDTSADGTYFAAGHEYSITVAAGTVDGVSQVGVEIASFSIANRSALRPTVAGRAFAVDSNGKAPATIAAGDLATDAVDAASVKADAVTKIANGHADLANGVVTGLTPRMLWRLMASVFGGKASGGGTGQMTYRDYNDTKDVLVVDVTQYGDRTNWVTRDP